MSSSTPPTTITSSSSSSPANPEATTPEVAGHHHQYHHWYSYYLNTLPPTWDTLQKGLALFAVLVILRSFIARLSAWSSSLTKPRAASTSPTPSRLLSSSSSSSSSIKLHLDQDRDSFVHFDPQHAVAAGDPNRTTIHHFRPYIHQRYPGSLPPWVKEPPKFHMDQGRLLTNPLEAGDNDGASPASVGFGDAPGVDSPDGGHKMPGGAGDQTWKAVGTGPLRHLLARPPPAPPLTPPELSHPIFTLGARPYTHDSFIHQPNPDYASASSPDHSSGASPQPRRYSYSKTIPMGVPFPRKPSALMSGGDDAQDSDLAFSPSSYPPTSPLLPPAPPVIPTSSSLAHAADNEAGRSREIDLQGQVVSVLDQDGAGWKRHTRVYGGGVCLACKAAGQEHGAGGFYGATVSPEEMR